MKNDANWKERMIRHWITLAELYEKARSHPSVRRWLSVLASLVKIIVSILVKKALERIMNRF